MKKSTLNFIINTVMFICMSAIVGIGFLLKFTLIPGQERRIKYGSNVELYLFGMDRHEWGTIHLIIGFILLGLLLLHIMLHWKVIMGVYHRIIQIKLVKKIVALSFIIISVLLIVTPLFIKPKIVIVKSKKEYHRTNNIRNDSKYVQTNAAYQKNSHLK